MENRSRRLKILEIDLAYLVNSGQLNYDGITTKQLISFKGVPKDASFVAAQIVHFGSRLQILLYSEEFPEVSEAEEIPRVDLFVSRERILPITELCQQ